MHKENTHTQQQYHRIIEDGSNEENAIAYCMRESITITSSIIALISLHIAICYHVRAGKWPFSHFTLWNLFQQSLMEIPKKVPTLDGVQWQVVSLFPQHLLLALQIFRSQGKTCMKMGSRLNNPDRNNCLTIYKNVSMHCKYVYKIENTAYFLCILSVRLKKNRIWQSNQIFPRNRFFISAFVLS